MINGQYRDLNPQLGSQLRPLTIKHLYLHTLSYFYITNKFNKGIPERHFISQSPPLYRYIKWKNHSVRSKNDPHILVSMYWFRIITLNLYITSQVSYFNWFKNLLQKNNLSLATFELEDALTCHGSCHHAVTPLKEGTSLPRIWYDMHSIVL